MDIETIEKYITASLRNHNTIDIRFKGRPTVTGLFVRALDYDELKSKNFWRIVQAAQLSEWKRTNDIGLAKIFYGVSFTSLSNNA